MKGEENHQLGKIFVKDSTRENKVLKWKDIHTWNKNLRIEVRRVRYIIREYVSEEYDNYREMKMKKKDGKGSMRRVLLESQYYFGKVLSKDFGRRKYFSLINTGNIWRRKYKGM